MNTDERLENLERELARAKGHIRWLLAAVCVALGVWFVAGTFGPARAGSTAGAPPIAPLVNEVRAKQFILVDDGNNTRAVLYATKGGPVLFLKDETGKPRAALDMYGLLLSDENGKPRAMMGVFEDRSRLDLYDENGKTRAGLTATKDGPALGLNDENGKTRAGLTVTKDGPALGLYDENGNSRATVGVTQTKNPEGKTTTYPESSLLLYGTDGKVIWQAR